MAKNLRNYIDWLEKNRPEYLVRIKKPIKAAYEITALQRKLHSVNKYPVIIAERPILDNGEQSAYPIITNVTSSRDLCAEILGIDPHRVGMEYSALQAKRRQPVKVSKKDAPVKEVIEKDKNVNVLKFPIMTHNLLDPGPYIGGGFVSTYDPDTGIDNCGLQRIWAKSSRRTGLWALPASHNWANIQKWWTRGENCPVAVWIGHHPAGLSGAQSKLGYPESHYPAMGGVLGEAVGLVPTETFGDKLCVPAEAEIVIEGYVPRDLFETEGPFGEYTGYTGPQRPCPVIDVVCVTHRKDAIYHGVGVGQADHLVFMGNFTMEARIYTMVKPMLPELVNVYVPMSGARNHAYLQVDKTRPGIGKEAIMAALPTDFRLKHIFVVDTDVDLFDEREILWSIAYRSQWDKDLVVVKGAVPSPLDPSLTAGVVIGTRGGIDATPPPPIEPGLPRYYAQRNKSPDEVMARLKLEDYVDSNQIQKFPGSY